MTRNIKIILFTIYIFSCKNRTSDHKYYLDDWRIINSIKQGKVNEKFSLSLKKIDAFTYSFSGRWFIVKDRIILFDDLYRLITVFNFDGVLFNQYGGLNVSELQDVWTRPYSILPYDTGYVSIFDRSVAFLDREFRVKKINSLNFEGNKNSLSMLELPDPENMNAYELNERNRNFFHINNKEILVSLESEAPLFNPYNTESYYRMARSFGLVNLNNKSLSPVPIGKSKVYNDTCCLTFQDGNYITGNDKMYFVQFAADTLIYVYNQNFEKEYAFGVKGKFILNQVINNGLEVAFDYDKYLNIEQNANVFENIFNLKNGYVGRILNNRTEKKKWIQLFIENQLDRQFEIPSKFSFIGVYENAIYFVCQNELKKSIDLCIIR